MGGSSFEIRQGTRKSAFQGYYKTPQVQQEQAQAAREARARNNPQADFGAATFARGAAEFGEGMNQMASHFCRQFGDKSNAWNTNEKKRPKRWPTRWVKNAKK